MSDETDRVVIGTVDGSPMYGTQAEATAAKLPYGTRVRVTRPNGDVIHGSLMSVWLFDGLMFRIKLACAGESTFSFDLGDVIEPVDEQGGKKETDE